MNKHIKVLVNGKPYEVEIEPKSGSSSRVRVNGVEYEVELENSSPNPPGSAQSIQAESRKVVEVPRSAPRAAIGAANLLTAPMPGVILDIAVKVGERVEFGGMLCALEAMKMKNAIRANHEVIIASVEVHEGQKVAHGDVLFRFA